MIYLYKTYLHSKSPLYKFGLILIALMASGVIHSMAQVSATYTKVDIGCKGNRTGSVNLSVCGGTSLYSFIWSNSPTTQNISGLLAGTYNVAVTDAGSLTTTASATITEPVAGISIASTLNNVLCHGE